MAVVLEMMVLKVADPLDRWVTEIPVVLSWIRLYSTAMVFDPPCIKTPIGFAPPPVRLKSETPALTAVSKVTAGPPFPWIVV